MLILFTVLLACVGTGRYYVKKYEQLLGEKQQVIDLATRTAYVTVAEVLPGEVFSEQNTTLIIGLTDEEQESLAGEVMGKVACTGMDAGMFVHKNQCREESCTETERECIFTEIEFADGFSEYELVDVRLRYPNGENYCVLKKKRLHKTEGNEKESRLRLTEGEQVLMSAALYDASFYTGTRLYFVSYLAEELQKESESYYIPPYSSIMQLLPMEDKAVPVKMSWIALREELEIRLEETKEAWRDRY